jgi:putative transposase
MTGNTENGSVTIDTPRDRAGTFQPRLVAKGQTRLEGLSERVIALYAGGMTTREIKQHVEALYHFEASEMFVTRIVERLEPELESWRSRPLEKIYPVVFVDALHVKTRHASGSRLGVYSTALYTVSGYGESGTLEILGASLRK